jgi:hypothetical protein
LVDTNTFDEPIATIFRVEYEAIWKRDIQIEGTGDMAQGSTKSNRSLFLSGGRR